MSLHSPDGANSARWWRYATALALAALACALLLGGVSAWFLGSVAIAGLSAAAYTFNFHVPGALVRLFAVGRTAARYGERLAGHKAALSDQTARRVGLFSSMSHAPAVRSAGWQLGDQARLADYLDDVEDLDFARLRANLPAMALGGGLAACLAATAFVAPLALVPIVAAGAATALAGRRLMRAGAPVLEQARAARRHGAQRLGAAAVSVVPLQAEGAWDERLAEAMTPISQADRSLLSLRRAQALFDMLAAMAGPLAAVATIGAAWLAGARGEGLLVPVFVAFAWIALGEWTNGASRILVAVLRRRAADAAISQWTGTAKEASGTDAALPQPSLLAEALQRRAPDGRALSAPIFLHLEAGRPTVLAGPSGSGKTSLLKQIAGWIGDDAFTSGDVVLDAAARRTLSTYCPHDAAILSDALRANLFAPGRSDEELRQALEAVELVERIGNAGGLDGWISQDVLSLGEAQRLNLARAWLSDRPVVLLDEPAEHLDPEQGARILERLALHLRGRIVVLSSHRPVDLPGAVVVGL